MPETSPNNTLQGSISFLTDNNGIKKAIVFDLANEYVQELVEDLFDSIIATERMNEPVSDFEQVKKHILHTKQPVLHVA